jgi:N-acetylglucosamine-6-phosphate deacetylase
MPTLAGQLVTPCGVVPGRLSFAETIERLESGAASGPYILPGFIDTHVHGGGGGDTMDGPEGVRTLARFHLKHGTTTLYPTTITNPWEKILAALRGVKEVMKEVMAAGDSSLPSIPGAHLEGPFISSKRLGAQPPDTQEPSAEKLAAVLEPGVVKLVTLAPEIPGALQAAEAFARAYVRVSVGHTVASYEQVRALIETVQRAGGTVGFTHLYNAMGGLAGREPGVVGAAFSQRDTFAELIFDTHHVHAGSLLAALAAKGEKLHLITDAIRACGMTSGESELGGQKVIIKNGAAHLPSGTLAGSVLTLEQALRNAVAAGVGLAQVSRMLSGTPARYLGLADRGELAPGKRADLTVLDEELKVREVYVGGRAVGSGG